MTKKRNYFMSYHHATNYRNLLDLREKFKDKNFSDYGFKEEDLGESSKKEISRKIQYRIWSSSLTIVLVGEETGKSAWIDWEIWYSLREIQGKQVSRRKFNPKGLLAIFLPNAKHSIPMRLKQNLDSGFAKKIYWDELDQSFDKIALEAYENRVNTKLIQNDLPLEITGKDNSINSLLNFKCLLKLFKTKNQ